MSKDINEIVQAAINQGKAQPDPSKRFGTALMTLHREFFKPHVVEVSGRPEWLAADPHGLETPFWHEVQQLVGVRAQAERLGSKEIGDGPWRDAFVAMVLAESGQDLRRVLLAFAAAWREVEWPQEQGEGHIDAQQ